MDNFWFYIATVHLPLMAVIVGLCAIDLVNNKHLTSIKERKRRRHITWVMYSSIVWELLLIVYVVLQIISYVRWINENNREIKKYES